MGCVEVEGVVWDVWTWRVCGDVRVLCGMCGGGECCVGYVEVEGSCGMCEDGGRSSCGMCGDVRVLCGMYGGVRVL